MQSRKIDNELETTEKSTNILIAEAKELCMR